MVSSELLFSNLLSGFGVLRAFIFNVTVAQVCHFCFSLVFSFPLSFGLLEHFLESNFDSSMIF